MIAMLNVMQLSATAFASLGIEELAYVKRISRDADDVFAIHSADGCRLAVMANEASAIAAIRRHNMHAAAVH